MVGRATDGMRLVEEALQLEPALVLTDVALPRLSGLSAARRLRKELPGTRVVFLASQEDPQVVAEALPGRGQGLRPAQRQRARAHLRASDGPARGAVALARPRRRQPEALPGVALVPGPFGRLSPRRREVVELLAEGHSMKQAAAALGITPRTVAFHKYRAMKALAVTSSAQLVRCAFESRLLGAGGN